MSFIDKNTHEIVDNVFEVDDDIAETISILNKKGYNTKACCSGHSFQGNSGYIVCKKEYANEIEDNISGHYLILGETDKEMYLICGIDYAKTYIVFNDVYDFEKAPEEFEYTKKWNSLDSNKKPQIVSSIEHLIYKYKDNGQIKTMAELDIEIKKYNKILLEWAKDLPYNIEKNNENESKKLVKNKQN